MASNIATQVYAMRDKHAAEVKTLRRTISQLAAEVFSLQFKEKLRADNSDAVNQAGAMRAAMTKIAAVLKEREDWGGAAGERDDRKSLLEISELVAPFR